MSRKLIAGNDVLSFNPANGIITVKGYVPISKLLLINNATRNTTIFNFSDPTAPAVCTYDSDQNTTTIDLSYNTTLMSASDKIQVYYEKEEIEIKPSRTYRDPVSKLRVSTPETLIDTDFEYGPQPTKWETVKLINNVPTSYSSPFTENSIVISSVNVSSGSDVMVVETSQPHNLPIGGVVEISGLVDSQFEGTFIVKTATTNSFSVKLSFASNRSGVISTIYSIAYKGAFYTGSSITVEEVSTSTGAASTITTTTPNIHGFKDRTKLYLKNSRATKKYSFIVPTAVVGIGTTNYKSEIKSSDFSTPPAPEYYNNLRVITDDIIGKFEINTSSASVNTSNGNITYTLADQQNDAALSGISTGQVLSFYTHVENGPLQKTGPANIENFTPFRVLSVSANAGVTTFRLAESYASSLAYVPTSAGTVSFGNHRFIRGHRIVQFVFPYTIVFSSAVDFALNDQLILTTNYTPSTYDSLTRSYITRYNGQYNKNSYPYYIYTISGISEDKKSVTVNATWGTFNSVNVETSYVNNIWAASAVRSHPLANSVYLPPAAGFSTSSYEDYQYIKYLNPNSATRIPSLSDNTNYILRQTSKKDWYRIAYADNSTDSSTSWENPIDLYFNVASNPNNPANTNGTATNVLTVGIHTITSSQGFKNSNTISLPERGGLENNSIVVYNSTVTPIGNLTANNSYRVKTEDVSLSSDRFRLSSSTESVKLYGFSYSAGSTSATVYVYDTKDRVSADASASDGLVGAGIINGNTIQISGSSYINPIKKDSINRSFKVTSSPSVYTSTTKDPSSPAGTVKYIYSFTIQVPQDGTFNTQTSISIFVGQTYADTALGNAKATGIIDLDISNSGTNGEHVLTQNVDGAVDDIYEVVNSSSKSFQFNTKIEIPQITKNIANFGGSAESAITLNSSGSFSISNNGTTSLQASPSFSNSFSWRSVVGNTAYSAPVAIEFRLSSNTAYYFSAGLTEFNSTGLNYSEGYVWYQNTYNDFGRYPYGYAIGNVAGRDSDISSTNVYKIEYGLDGNIRWYKNGTIVATSNIGTGKTLRPFVSYLDYTVYTSSSQNVNNFKIASSALPFTPGSTNYLKVASHNFADGTEVTYQTTGAQSILPLVNNQNYFVRVLDGDYIGLTSSFESAVDRSASIIGFTTTGSSGATNNLLTNSVKGFLNGKGTVALSTSSTLVNGTDTNFLTDFSNGDTFRAYRLGVGTPGQYFESKIVSIKGDKVLKLESIPTFASNTTSYFKQTALYAVSDGKVSHRPFDGGVAMYSGLVPNTRIIRQTRKYFRYQSGKGIQVSMAVNFNPTNDIDLLTKVGVGATSIYQVKSKFPHKLSENAVNSQQKITISSVVSSASTFFNRTTSQIGFPIKSISDDFNFTVDIGNNVNVDDIGGFPKYSVQNWKDSALRAGLFDDQNGFFFEYDGETLYAVRRSSTQQLSGQFEVQRNSYFVQGQNSILTRQVSANDYIVIRGQTYKVISVLGDSSLNIQPAYRGSSSTNVVISKVINTKVPQSEWNIDKMDGTGETGYKLDINKIQMIYMDYSWYGAGSVRFGFKDQIGEVKYCHEFVHNNIFTESYFRSGNIPARYEVETFDDPLYSPALSHWGVSVIMDGRFDDDKAYLFTADSDALTFSGDGSSTEFTGTVTQGSSTMTGINATEYQSLVVGQTLVPTASYPNFLSSDTKISAINIDSAGTRFGGSPTYKITMSKPALAGSPTSIALNAFAGNAVDIQNNIPLVSIRLSPSVDNSNIGNLGFRDIINRMQLTLKSAGVLTTHDCEVRLILNGKLSDESFASVTSPSLSQVYKHQVGDKITEGITIFSFRARGGDIISTTSGRRNLNGTDVSLTELALLGNSILGGDGTFPDGPDVLTLVVKPLEPSSINGGSPLVVSARITWTEAQA